MLTSTKTPVTEIPRRAMLDLEEIGGGGFRDSYAVLSHLELTDDGRPLILVEYEGELHSLLLDDPGQTIPVIAYAASNALEISPTHSLH